MVKSAPTKCTSRTTRKRGGPARDQHCVACVFFRYRSRTQHQCASKKEGTPKFVNTWDGAECPHWKQKK
jgi:hypothetical protein